MHWITRAAATTATAIALVLPVAGSAQAAPAADANAILSGTPSSTLASADCPSGWLCLYEHTNYQGRMLKFRDNNWQQLSGYGFNDKTSSWKNRLGRSACLSRDWPAGGSRISLSANGRSSSMGNWNDKASGVKAGRC